MLAWYGLLMRDPPARHARAHPGREPAGPTWGWVVLVFVLAVFVLGVLGGVVALAYSPLVQGLFGPATPEPAAPAGEIDDVPAPDNTVTQTDERFEREAEARMGESGEVDESEGGEQAGPPPPIEGLDTPVEDPQ